MSAPHEKRPAFEPATRLLRPTGYNPNMTRPASLKAGVSLLVLRILSGVAVLVFAAAAPDAFLDTTDLTSGEREAIVATFVAAASIVLIIDLVLVRLVWLGRNGARVAVLIVTALSITTTFVGWWQQGQEITLAVGLVPLGLDVLVLLALSSRDAAAYARRNEKH